MSLLFHHGSDAFDTKVSTRGGVVTLTGTAENQAEIDLASKRVNDIYGVKSVVNKMTIEVSRSSTN
jgi:osmotically-inducible protein OsmY